MSKYRTLTSGLSLGDAYRLQEKQAAAEQARQQQRKAQQEEERRVLQANKAQAEAQRRMQEEVIRTRDALDQRAQDAGGVEGLVFQPLYAGGTGAIDGLGPPGELATWAGEQAVAHGKALVQGGDPEANYRDLVAYREMAQQKNPKMTMAGELVGSYAKQKLPPWISVPADTAAGATMEGINNGFTRENLFNGAKEAFTDSVAGLAAGAMLEKPFHANGFDFDSRGGRFTRDMLGVAGDKLVEEYKEATDKRPPPLSEDAWRPAAQYLFRDPGMDPELVRRIETQLFVGGKPRGIAEAERRLRRGGL